MKLEEALTCIDLVLGKAFSTLYRVVLNETGMTWMRPARLMSFSTLYRVVLNETAPLKTKVAMIFDLQTVNSLVFAFWCIEFVSFYIVT